MYILMKDDDDDDYSRRRASIHYVVPWLFSYDTFKQGLQELHRP